MRSKTTALGTAGDVDIGGILAKLSLRVDLKCFNCPFGYRNHVTWWGRGLFRFRLKHRYPRLPYTSKLIGAHFGAFQSQTDIRGLYYLRSGSVPTRLVQQPCPESPQHHSPTDKQRQKFPHLTLLYKIIYERECRIL